MKNNQQLTNPQEIIDARLREALKPYSKQLLEAAAKDASLEAETDASHPDKVKREAQQLFEAACNGDKTADKTLREASGTAGYIEAKTRFFDLTRGKREAAAKADAAIWAKAGPAAVAALDAALALIRQQWTATLQTLGEEVVPSSWETKVGYLRRALEKVEFNARELRHGTAWQVESLGLRKVLQ
jgi:regulator of protease activity HflC (stomatin/prohibitin superfamily)